MRLPRLLFIAGLIVLAVVSVIPLSAFEAHVVGVRAVIENPPPPEPIAPLLLSTEQAEFLSALEEGTGEQNTTTEEEVIEEGQPLPESPPVGSGL